MRKIRINYPEIIALITGACVMTLEIVGARLIAPFFGMSTYVWTAMIGVILGSLSLGFWVGGKLADNDNPKESITKLLVFGSVSVFLMGMVYSYILDTIENASFDLRISAILSAFLLFSIPSILIGAVSPHLAKIQVKSLKTSGSSIGRLEAAGAIGSILGTFLSGYFLLQVFGSWQISIGISIVLVLTSFIGNTKQYILLRAFILSCMILALIIGAKPVREHTLMDVDSSYNRYLVIEGEADDRKANLLMMDGYSVQSAHYTDGSTEPVLDYAKKIEELLEHDFNNIHNVLIVGGGAHTLPMLLQTKLPNSTIDVVEIDKALDQIAETYFGFKKGPKTNVHYEDGRTFLNKVQKKYDVIIMDAYSSLTPPFHLSTREAVQKMYLNLSDTGIVISNVVSKKDGFLNTIYTTHRDVFQSVKVISINSSLVNNSNQKQNFLIISSKTPSSIANGALANEVFPKTTFVLTDDFSPVESLSF